VQVEVYRKHSSSVGDLTNVTIATLGRRLRAFDKAHTEDLKFQAALAGVKL
jgi:hypothetical protein